jgi:hypothetical protein
VADAEATAEADADAVAVALAEALADADADAVSAALAEALAVADTAAVALAEALADAEAVLVVFAAAFVDAAAVLVVFAAALVDAAAVAVVLVEADAEAEGVAVEVAAVAGPGVATERFQLVQRHSCATQLLSPGSMALTSPDCCKDRESGTCRARPGTASTRKPNHSKLSSICSRDITELRLVLICSVKAGCCQAAMRGVRDPCNKAQVGIQTMI